MRFLATVEDRPQVVCGTGAAGREREELAANTAGSRRGPWHVSQSPALGIALSNAALTSLGLPSLFEGR